MTPKHTTTAVAMMALLVSAVLLSCMQAHAFVARPAMQLTRIHMDTQQQHTSADWKVLLRESNKHAVTSTKTQLGMSIEEEPSSSSAQVNDGTGRGLYLLGIVLAACVWCFTVPPEFRRAFICSEGCATNREAPVCNNCITSDEWLAKVQDYYANGGGIQWDFSIDPNSKMKMF